MTEHEDAYKKIFRFITIANIVFIILFEVHLIGYGHDFPQAAQEYQSWLSKQPMSQLEVIAEWIGMPALGASLIASIGLFFFRRWARLVFLVSIIVMLICGLPTKYPLLMTAEQNFFDSMVSLLSGLIFALAYWSPIKDNFKK